MEFLFQVSAEVERVSGPFASRDDIEAELSSEIEGADPGSVQPGDNEYEVTSWEVEALPVGKAAKKPKSDPQLLRTWQAIRATHERLTHATTMEEVKEDLARLDRMIDGAFVTMTKMKLFG